MSMLEEEKYPARVFTGGTGFLDPRSITHYCQLKKILNMKVYIGTDAYDDIKNNSQLGVIVKLAELEYEFRGKYIQQLLCNMLSTSMPHELWVLADGRPIRFSLHEFEHITGLKCHAEDDDDSYAADVDIWEELPLRYGQGPTWMELERMLRICGDWSLVKRKMVGLLVVQHFGIFGLHQNSRIPSKYVKLVGVPQRFEEHPWGRVAFQALIRSIRQCCMDGGRLKLYGLVYVLLVWSFEHIPRLGAMCGKRRIGGVPLLNWTCRYTRGGCLEDFFEAEKRVSGEKKVRVVHFVEKSYEDMYPEWYGEKVVDVKVDRMMRDIFGGQLDETFWVVGTSNQSGSKRKRKAKCLPVEIPKKAKETEGDKEKENEMLKLHKLTEQYNSDKLKLDSAYGKHGEVLREFSGCYRRLKAVKTEIAVSHMKMQETADKLGEVVRMLNRN